MESCRQPGITEHFMSGDNAHVRKPSRAVDRDRADISAAAAELERMWRVALGCLREGGLSRMAETPFWFTVTFDVRRW